MPAAAKAKKKRVISRAKKSVKTKARKPASARSSLKLRPAGKATAGKKKKAIKVKVKMLGRVVHYYDKIGVAIIEVISPITVGDTVKFRHGESEMEQPVMSMQIEHAPVAKAKKGDVIGLKVMAKLPDGTMVLPG
jgi:hypothetical protein